MRILEIHIDGFGKLVDYHWVPSDGFNVVLGANEAGKSTLLAFIRAMLYGLNARKNMRDLQADPRRRFLPWSTKATYGGSLLLEHGGIRYRINRRFGEVKRDDSLQVYYEDSNTIVNLPRQDEPGDYLFSISEDEFVNTVFIQQMQTEMNPSENIQSKLMQLSSGSGPERSVGDMKALLQERIKELQRNSAQSPDRILQAEISALESKLEEAIRTEERRVSLRHEIAGMQDTLNAYTAELEQVRASLGIEALLRERSKWASLVELENSRRERQSELAAAMAAMPGGRLPTSEELEEASKLLGQWAAARSAIGVLRTQLDQIEANLKTYASTEELVESGGKLAELRIEQERIAEAMRDYREQVKDDEESFEKKLAAEEQKLSSLEQAAEDSKRDRELAKQAYKLERTKLEQAVEDLLRRQKEMVRELDAEAKQVEGALKSGEARLEELEERLAERKASANAAEDKRQQAYADLTQAQVSMQEARASRDVAAADLAKLGTVEADEPRVKPLWLGLAAILLIAGVLFLVMGSTGLKIAGAVLLLAGLGVAVYASVVSRQAQDARSIAVERRSLATDKLLERERVLVDAQSRYETLLAETKQEPGSEEESRKRIRDLDERVRNLTAEQAVLILRLDEVLAAREAQTDSPLQADIDQAVLALEASVTAYSEADRKRDELIQEQLEEAKSQAKQLQALNYRLPEDLQTLGQTLTDMESATLLALRQLGIEDRDRLKAEEDRIARALADRQAQERQADENRLELGRQEAQTEKIVEAFYELLGEYVPRGTQLEAAEATSALQEQLRNFRDEERQIRALLMREAEIRGEVTEDAVPARIEAIEESLRECDDAYRLYESLGADALRTREETLRRLELQLGREQATAENNLRLLEQDILMPPDLEREIQAKEAEYNELLMEVESLEKAISMLNFADEEMRSSFGPKIDQKTGMYLERLTGEASHQLKVTSSFDVNLAGDGSMLYEDGFYSGGKIDQIYLALRLAVGETIYDRDLNLPFFYDDVLVQYDSLRCQQTLDFLVSHSRDQGRQVFFMTCHDHLAKLAESKYGLLIHKLQDERI